MILDGEPEPALVGPWTTGLDKKNPKPLDVAAFDPHAVLRAHDALGEPLAEVRVAANFKLSATSATAWIDDSFRKTG